MLFKTTDYRGATVEDLDIRPAISVNPSTPLKGAFEVAFEHEFTFLPVIHETNKRLLGVLKIQDETVVTDSRSNALTKDYMLWFSQPAKEKYTKDFSEKGLPTPFNSKILKPRPSGGKHYEVLTPLSSLEELGSFFNAGNYFAIITNGRGSLVYGVVTREDLKKYEASRPHL